MVGRSFWRLEEAARRRHTSCGCCLHSHLQAQLQFHRGRKAVAAATPATASTVSHEKHYVVIGAGLAGLATAYHLLKQSPVQAPVRVTVYDAVGIGAGGSGAAAGLLHPFAPTGKLLWHAQEAMSAALELLEAAEAAAAAAGAQQPGPVAWRTGMLKPATTAKQSQSFWRLYGAQQQQHQQQLQHDQHEQSQPQQQQQGPQLQGITAVVAGQRPGATKPSTAQQLAGLLSGAVVDASTAQQLLPGVQLPTQLPPQQQHHQQQQSSKRPRREQQLPPAGWSAELSAAMHIQGGITLQPLQYMQSLWDACQQLATDRQDGSSINLQIQQLHSLAQVLQQQQQQQQQQQAQHTQHTTANHHCSQQQQQPAGQCQHVDAFVVAAGAAVGSLAEIGQQLPLKLCQGYTLDMAPPAAAAADVDSAVGVSCAPADAVAAAGGHSIYPCGAPSVLGTPYLASQGGQLLVVGATKQYNLTSEQAVAELGRCIDPSILHTDSKQLVQQQEPQQAAVPATSSSPATQADTQAGAGTEAAAAPSAAGVAAEVAAAAQELLGGAAAMWPGIQSWSVAGIRTGVRALPPKSAQGAMPIAGRLHAADVVGPAVAGQKQDLPTSHSRVPVWLLVGLGARGLLYHGWLGKLTAAAVLNNSEEGLPSELLSWRQLSPKSSSSTRSADQA